MTKQLITDTDSDGYPFILDDDDETALVKPDYQANLHVANDALKAHDAAIEAAQEAAEASVQPSELDAHQDDTTNVHGIPDTSVLETQDGAQAKADAAYAQSQTYIDAQLGLRPLKDPARVALSTNVNLATPGALVDNGGDTPVTVQTNDRILLFGQTEETENGPYRYNGSSSALTRTTDADSTAEMKPGLIIAVTEGTYADKLFELKTDAPITLGSTALVFDLAAGGGNATPLIAYSGSNYAPRNTVTSSSTTPVTWVGPVAPTVGSGYALAGVDLWINSTEVN